MIGIIIVTHAAIGDAYRHLAQHFFPHLPNHIRLIGVFNHEDHCSVIANVHTEIADLGTPHGVLVLTDIFGATPCNAVRKLLTPNQVAILTGLNAPMMLKAIQYSTQATDLNTFIEQVKQAAIDGIFALTTPPESEN